MRFVISVVDRASVVVAEQHYEAHITKGLLIYVGISRDDTEDFQDKIQKFVQKISTLKCFHADGKISQSLEDVRGEILLISNFTLYGTSANGQKLDFSQSADYASAEKIYDVLVTELSKKTTVKTGIFGGLMDVDSLNSGPINLVFDF